MSSSLDKSLDDIIRSNSRSRGHAGNFRGRGSSGPGPDRTPVRHSLRPDPYPVRPSMLAQATMWQPQMIPIGESHMEEDGTKLYISNLDYGVSNDDIKLLFTEVGELKRYSIHYDRSGRSKGTAEVVFIRQADALSAIKRYHNVQLDGKPMKIELVGVNLVTPVPVPTTSYSILGKPNGAFRSGQERVVARGWARDSGGVGGGSARGRGRVRRRGEKVSVEDLDAELERYHVEALQIN
ncbi:RRM_1 domain-containing protein [Cephalotus follicularis]|uniref:RRM_1 domain-containing protein n=1 Tax=Cephalotus follicularis TaxID=3775 RepID=A0A1Q3C7K8_CEPFO|nr:RRM_1 domain-containing protein [Cephalotus follicularis]